MEVKRAEDLIEVELQEVSLETSNWDAVLESIEQAASVAPERAERVGVRQLSSRRLADLFETSPLIALISPLPRSIKKTMNRLNFLLIAARSGDMFGGRPHLGAEHLLKWAILVERWPEVVESAERDPSVLARFESAARGEGGADLRDWATTAAALGYNPNDDDALDLRRFLSMEPLLAPLLMRILHFDPAPH